MNFFRVGIIDFFGILCPGVLLLINLSILLFTCNVHLDQFWKSISKEDWGSIIFLSLFVICYLFGFVLRLISPDYVDKISTFFGKLIAPMQYIEKHKMREKFGNEGMLSKNISRRKRNKQFKTLLEEYYAKLIEQGKPLPHFFWNDELYPYYFGLKCVYYRNLPNQVAHAIMQDKHSHNKDTFNFWKTLIASRNPNVATLVFQAEAFVRFMSGSFWAIIIGILSGIILITTNLGSYQKIAIGISLTFISILMAAVILNRFKNQRRREVKILLDAIFVISKAGNEFDPLGQDCSLKTN